MLRPTNGTPLLWAVEENSAESSRFKKIASRDEYFLRWPIKLNKHFLDVRKWFSNVSYLFVEKRNQIPLYRPQRFCLLLWNYFLLPFVFEYKLQACNPCRFCLLEVIMMAAFLFIVLPLSYCKWVNDSFPFFREKILDGFEFKRHIDRAAELNPRSENMDQSLYFSLLSKGRKRTLAFWFYKMRWFSQCFGCGSGSSLLLNMDPHWRNTNVLADSRRHTNL